MAIVWTIVKTAAVLAAGWFLTTRALPWLVVRTGRLLGFRMRLNPTTARRWERFRRIKRGYYAFLAVCTLLVLSLFLELLVNSKPLAIGYDGRVAFPAVKHWLDQVCFFADISSFYPRDEFGQSGRNEVDYRLFAATVADPAVGKAQIAELRREVDAWLAEHPKPPDDASDRTKARWQRGFARFEKRLADIEPLEAKLKAFEEGRAWILPPLYFWGPSDSRLDFPDTVRLKDGRQFDGRLTTSDEATVVIESGGRTLSFRRDEVASDARGNPPNPPSVRFGIPLGTDVSGRDLLVHMLYGFRISLFFSLLIAAAGSVLGVIIGALQGYYGRWIDILSQRAVEIWSSIPFLFVIMIIAAARAPTFLVLVGLMIALRSWIGITYYVRGEFYREKAKDYVQAAIGMGVPDWRIMLGHILPNSLVPIVTFLPFSIVGYITVLVSLDYLGFGLPPGTPSWGGLLKQGLENVRHHPHLVVIPTTALVLTLYAIVLVGEAVREAFDPKVFSRLR